MKEPKQELNMVDGLPVIVTDTREQKPLAFPHLTRERGTLATGDYSVKGLEHRLAVERKSMADMVGSLTHDRTRFMAELQRMRAYECRRLLMIGTQMELKAILARRAVKLEQILGSLACIDACMVPVVWVQDAAQAALEVERLAFWCWREARKTAGLKSPQTPPWARAGVLGSWNTEGGYRHG